MTVLLLFALVTYGFGALLQAIAVVRPYPHDKLLVLVVGFFAVVLHGALLHHFIDGTEGQNLSAANMFSLSAWLLSILLIMIASLKRVEILSLLIFPLAMLSIILLVFFPQAYLVNTATQPIMLFHIFISVLALGIFCFAAFVAVMIALEEYLLRSKHAALMQKFPPLLTSEKLLFQCVTIGFILLSLVLSTSVYFYFGLVMTHFVLLQKTVLTAVAWLIFAVLLFGRYYWGWRGRRALYGTVFGVTFLTLAYFVSKLVLEVLH